MAKKVKVYEVPPEGGPRLPSKIIVESPNYIHSFLIVRTAEGVICKPWAVPEMSKIITGKFGKSMAGDDFVRLKNHERWALSKAQEWAKKLASKQQMKLL